MVERDTIYALSSGRPPAAIAVIRISGPRASEALQRLTGRVPPPRKAALVTVRAQGEDIDQALALWFPAPSSETGEPMAELQLHGGRAVIAATLAALARIKGLRPAEAGEFTRRAFENGKLDLTAVEGLADLVMADTSAQRQQAYRQLRGLLGNRAEVWRGRLIAALALVEARIDFSDEADVPQNLLEPARSIARELAAEIGAVLDDKGRGERLREGLVVAIAGPPNAGKSTLLNRIARREAAIVSPVAGTTRDVIEVHLDLGGAPVTFLDTAGIRDTDDPVELEGVRRARERAGEADLVLWVFDAAESALAPEQGARQTLWLVANKADLLPDRNESKNISSPSTDEAKHDHAKSTEADGVNTSPVSPARAERNEHKSERNELVFNSYSISALTGEGVEPLLTALANHAAQFLDQSEPALITRERHRRALTDTLEALQRTQQPEHGEREDLLAEDLRLAARALGRLTGRIDVEDVLDAIFRDFCIGK